MMGGIAGISATLFWARFLLLAALWGAVVLLAWIARSGEAAPGGMKRRGP